MIYLDGDFMDQFNDQFSKEDKLPPSLFQNIEIPEEDEFDDDFDEEAFDALCLRFANSYSERVMHITIDLYPQFQTKKALLEEQLIEDGKGACGGMFELQDDYIDFYRSIAREESQDTDICIHDIGTFIRNSTLDHMLENYQAWFKKKISFENIYVESFFVGVYTKRIHNLLINMLHEFFPAMNCLPSEQLNQVYASLLTEAWHAYSTLTKIDPDELNDSTVIYNLEDYEFETLLKWPGPEIVRNAAGEITEFRVRRNEPNPSLLPSLCLQCKRYHNKEEIDQLCSVYRVDKGQVADFKCRAYENFQHS